ncbi:MAG TPA: ABC transporter permease [Chloroflexota bacterium]|nr:ABC transporter permease [Chloroflexota bacterium]
MQTSEAPLAPGRGPLVAAEDTHNLVAPTPRGVWARLRREPIALICLIVIFLFVLAAALAPWLAPHLPNYQFSDGLTADGSPLGSSARFPLGTDSIGRDVLSRILFGARISLTVGLLATALMIAIGVMLGATAGYFGGWVEMALMRLVDVMLALPLVPLALATVSVFGPSVPTTIIVIALTQWMYMARAVYAMVQSLREWEFVTAARAVGAGNWRILGRHIAPHLFPVLITYATLGIPGSILLEATLSFLNAGVPPPTASWGSMIADAQTYYRVDPGLMLFPGLALVLVVLAFTLLGDSLGRMLEAR